MTIEDALERSGTAGKIQKKFSITGLQYQDSLEKAKKLLETNEEILYAIYTAVRSLNKFGIAMPGLSKIKSKGFVIISVNCIKFIYYEINKIISVQQIPIKDIIRIEQFGLPIKKGLLTIYDYIYRWKIEVDNEGQLEGLKDAIHKAQAMQKAEETSHNVPLVADEILKLKELSDKGIITEEEFQKKKKQLLNI